MSDRRAFLGGLGAFALTPAVTAAPSPGLDLAALEHRHGARIGLCVDDGTPRTGWRQDEAFAYCSTFKLFLAACILVRVQQGREALDRSIPIVRGDMVSHAPTTGVAVGSTLTVEQLCRAMVELSDNPAANILIREMGGLAAWQAWYRTLGDRITRVDRYEPALNSALPGDPRDTTTPRQAVANLDLLLRGAYLSPAHRAMLFQWLTDTPTGAGRIKAGVPDAYRVGHKTGTGERASHNDIGVLWPPAAGAILIAVYCTGATGVSPERIDAMIAEATRLSLRALAG